MKCILQGEPEWAAGLPATGWPIVPTDPIVEELVTRGRWVGECQLWRSNGKATTARVSITRLAEPGQPIRLAALIHDLSAEQRVVKKIVERHGGTLAVTSTPGSGTTFMVRLPALNEPAS
jgi:hypothetical protein